MVMSLAPVCRCPEPEREADGVAEDELRPVALLAMTTYEFPTAVAWMGRTNDVITPETHHP